jgi:hypothetical protein
MIEQEAMIRGSHHPGGDFLTDRRGQALALAAITTVGILAMGALAVDLGLAFAARAAAQRAADSAALAGASAFIDFDYTDPIAVDTANGRAIQFATLNDVLRKPIDASEVMVWVIPDSQKVRVRVEADNLPVFFARFLNISSLDVSASAAAVASEGGSSDKCVLPFAMPDLWDDFDDDDNPENNVPNDPEWWEFDPGDVYEPYQGPCPPTSPDCYNGTGLGSNLRDDATIDDDIGRRIWIKSAPRGQQGGGSGGDDGWGAGGLDVMIGPGNFLLWSMPDPDNDCRPKNGASWVRLNIAECNTCPISVGVDYPSQPGNVASIKDPLEDLMALDPDAEWDQTTKSVINSNAANWEDSPRVRIVPLWSPADYSLQGRSTFQFNNMAKIFIEGGGTNPPDFAIYARFLGMVDEGSGGTETGSLIKYLRLVE